MDPEITLTATTEEDGPILRVQHSTPEVAEWWDLPDPGFPMHDEPETTRLTIRYRGDRSPGSSSTARRTSRSTAPRASTSS